MKRKDKKSVSWRRLLLKLKPYSDLSGSFRNRRRPVRQEHETKLWLEEQLGSERDTVEILLPKLVANPVIQLPTIELEPIFYEKPKLPGIKFINHDNFERNRTNLARIFDFNPKQPRSTNSVTNELQLNTMTEGPEVNQRTMQGDDLLCYQSTYAKQPVIIVHGSYAADSHY